MRNMLLAIILSTVLTSLFWTNHTAHDFIARYGAKIGINIGNTVTGTPVCDVRYFNCSPIATPTVTPTP